MKLMLKFLNKSKNSVYVKKLHPIFLRSPVEFHGNNELKNNRFATNHLRRETIQNQIAETIGEFEESCLTLCSIGYKSVQVEDIPKKDEGCVENINDKVEGNEREISPLYIVECATTGPIVLTTMSNAFQVARLIYNELSSNGKRGDVETNDF